MMNQFPERARNKISPGPQAEGDMRDGAGGARDDGPGLGADTPDGLKRDRMGPVNPFRGRHGHAPGKVAGTGLRRFPDGD